MPPTNHRRPNGSRPIPVRSVRVTDDVWEKARYRANMEGVTMSYVVQVIMEGYASGMLDLPRMVMQYQHKTA